MPPTPYLSIANALVSRLETVPNIGRVHNYLRNLKSREEVIAEFRDESLGRVNGWMVSRRSFTDEQSGTMSNTRLATWLLRGYMAVEDSLATELLFQQVVDDVAAAFTPQDNLGGLVELIEPVQVPTIGHAWLGRPESGFLCHGAELTLNIQEFYQR